MDFTVDRWFIEEYKQLSFIDVEDIWHCILVTQKGKSDGVLVMSEGKIYPKWAAYWNNNYIEILYQMLYNTFTSKEHKNVKQLTKKFHFAIEFPSAGVYNEYIDCYFILRTNKGIIHETDLRGLKTRIN